MSKLSQSDVKQEPVENKSKRFSLYEKWGMPLIYTPPEKHDTNPSKQEP